MAIHFAANEAEAFDIVGDVASIATAGSFDSTLGRASMRCQNNGTLTVPSINIPAGLTELWVSADYYPLSTVTSNTGLVISMQVGSGTTAYARFLCLNNSTAARFEYWDGSVYQAMGANFLYPVTRVKLSCHIKIHPTAGWVRWYQDKALAQEFNGNTSSYAQLNFVKLSGRNLTTGNNAACSWSNVVVSDEDNREFKVATLFPNGAGAYSAWTGAYTDVDEELDIAGADMITSVTAGDRSTFTMSDLNVLYASNVTFLAVFTSSRGLKGVSGPTQLKHKIRLSSVDYDSSNIVLPAVVGPQLVRWNNDPSTATLWTYAGVNALESGVESVA